MCNHTEILLSKCKSNKYLYSFGTVFVHMLLASSEGICRKDIYIYIYIYIYTTYAYT